MQLMTLDPRHLFAVRDAATRARVLGLTGVFAIVALATQSARAVTPPAPATESTTRTMTVTEDAWHDSGYYIVGGRVCYVWSEDLYRCAPPTPRAAPTQAKSAARRPAPVVQSPPVRKTPIARPGGSASPGTQTIINEILSVIGPYGNQALSVARCESGLNPNALNPVSHAAGLFQFLASTWRTTSYASQSPFNASANIHAAYQVFSRDGDSWREWTCQP